MIFRRKNEQKARPLPAPPRLHTMSTPLRHRALPGVVALHTSHHPLPPLVHRIDLRRLRSKEVPAGGFTKMTLSFGQFGKPPPQPAQPGPPGEAAGIRPAGAPGAAGRAPPAAAARGAGRLMPIKGTRWLSPILSRPTRKKGARTNRPRRKGMSRSPLEGASSKPRSTCIKRCAKETTGKSEGMEPDMVPPTCTPGQDFLDLLEDLIASSLSHRRPLCIICDPLPLEKILKGLSPLKITNSE